MHIGFRCAQREVVWPWEAGKHDVSWSEEDKLGSCGDLTASFIHSRWSSMDNWLFRELWPHGRADGYTLQGAQRLSRPTEIEIVVIFSTDVYGRRRTDELKDGRGQAEGWTRTGGGMEEDRGRDGLTDGRWQTNGWTDLIRIIKMDWCMDSGFWWGVHWFDSRRAVDLRKNEWTNKGTKEWKNEWMIDRMKKRMNTCTLEYVTASIYGWKQKIHAAWMAEQCSKCIKTTAYSVGLLGRK